MGRAILLAGVVAAALLWAGLLPPLSGWVWKTDDVLRDKLSTILPAPKEREDLVFVGMDEEMRKQSGGDLSVVQQSRALTMMREEGGNVRLDRRVFAEVIDKLAA